MRACDDNDDDGCEGGQTDEYVTAWPKRSFC